MNDRDLRGQRSHWNSPHGTLSRRRSQVTALLRTPEKFPLRDKVQRRQGNAFDPMPFSRPSKELT